MNENLGVYRLIQTRESGETVDYYFNEYAVLEEQVAYLGLTDYEIEVL